MGKSYNSDDLVDGDFNQHKGGVDIYLNPAEELG
jgi:hypothetical protein